MNPFGCGARRKLGQKLRRETRRGYFKPILFFLAASFFFAFGSPPCCSAQAVSTVQAASEITRSSIEVPVKNNTLISAQGYFSSPIPLSYHSNAVEKKGEEGAARRGLIIAAGSFPFSYFYTNLAFDLVRYAVNGFDSLYAPWPFRTVGSVSIDTKETFLRLGVGAGLSLAIGLADILSR